MIPKLLARLGSGSPHRVVPLVGAAGAGKTTAIATTLAGISGAHHLRARHTSTGLIPYARCVIDQVDASVATPALGFAGAAAAARHLRHPARALGTWFASALGTQRLIIALDDLHLVERDPAVREFVVAAVEASHPNVRWLLASRDVGAWPIPWWMARSFSGMPFAIDAGPGALDDEALSTLVRAWLATASDSERDVAAALSLLPALDPSYVEAIDGAALQLERMVAAMPAAFAAGAMRAAAAATFVNAGSARAAELAARPLRASSPQALLELFAAVDDRVGIVRTLDRSGFDLLEAGRGDVVLAAIERLSPAERRGCPVSLMLEAKRESALGRHDVAEAWFVHAADNAADDATRGRIGLAHGSDLLRRARPDAIDVLERVAASSISAAVDAHAAASLAAAYAQSERSVLALQTLAPALRWAESERDLRHAETCARVYRQAAYVYLRCAEAERASVYAERAIALATTCGLDEIVASARSVSVAVSAQHDDDAKALLKHLRELERCARRLENEYLIRYALLAQIDAYGELADWQHVDRIEKQLGALQLENDTVHVDETLVRIRAMRAAAGGDFANAFALLSGPLHVASDPDMRALRQSELALYAAACGLSSDYRAAMANADAALEQSPSLDGAICIRAMLQVAAAAGAAGDVDGARARLAAVGAATAAYPRLEALRKLVDVWTALPARYDEAAALALLDAFSNLRAKGLGATAALLAMIPAHALALAS